MQMVSLEEEMQEEMDQTVSEIQSKLEKAVDEVFTLKKKKSNHLFKQWLTKRPLRRRRRRKEKRLVKCTRFTAIII